MNKQTLAILSIIALGSIVSVAYATNSSISDTSAILNNLTILGTCTGCGGSIVYSHYTTVALNTTVAGSTSEIFEMLVGNNGTVTFSSNQINAIVTVGGSTVTSMPSGSNPYSGFKTIDQSSDGYYQVAGNYTGNTIKVIKNNAVLQTLGYKVSQCSGGTIASMAISPNGKYIAAGCLDSGGATARIVVFQGS